MIYLDSAATTMVAPEVVEVMTPYFTDEYGNPDSIHSMGRKAAEAVEKAREQVAMPIGADPNDIIFTSGGSEANSLAITGLANYLRMAGKTHIITSCIEHHSVLEAMKSMFYHGFQITYLQPNKMGVITPEDLEAAIREDTGLVSLMGVNNEIGVHYDICGFGQVCNDHNVIFHTDCVQAYLSHIIDVDRYHIDLMSVSGHKFHAPKGIGFLYARHKEYLNPIIFGGEQEYGVRGGTSNVPYIAAIGKAAELCEESFLQDSIRVAGLRWRLLSGLLNGGVKMAMNGDSANLSKIVSVRFDGVDSETLLLLMNANGVIASAGSACSAHMAEPSHVLKAIGLSDEQAKSSIRLSISRYTAKEEIDAAASVIVDAVKKLQETNKMRGEI